MGGHLHVRLLCETPPIWKPRRDRRARSAKPGPPDPTASRQKEYPSIVPPILSIQSLQGRTSRLRRYAAAIPWLRPTTCPPEGRRRRTTCPTTPRRHRYVNHLASSDCLLEPRLAPRSAPLFLAPGTFPGFALGGALRLGSQTAARSELQSLNLSASRIANRNTQPQAAKCSRARIHPSRESPSP